MPATRKKAVARSSPSPRDRRPGLKTALSKGPASARRAPAAPVAPTPKAASGKASLGSADAVSLVTIDDANGGQRLDNFLAAKLKGVPKSHIYRIVRSGEVRVNKGRAEVDYRLVEGDLVRIPPIRVSLPETNTGAAFEAKMAEKARQSLGILFEDDFLIALDKPAGLAVHGGSGVSFGVIEALRAQRPEARFLELVHRLDRETSGVLLIAKKRSVLTAMHALLRAESGSGGRIQKHYYALVKGDWADEKRNLRMKLAKTTNLAGEKRVRVDEEGGQDAHTVVTRVERFGMATLLDCDIRTGRTHQIRVHLAHLGFPIVGDDKYGDFALNKVAQAAKNGGLKRMFLHARLIRFVHPVSGSSLTIESPPPPDLARYLAFLRGARQRAQAA
jgi:23S rRNA pseudouridine955/2504/2580 synthase